MIGNYIIQYESDAKGAEKMSDSLMKRRMNNAARLTVHGDLENVNFYENEWASYCIVGKNVCFEKIKQIIESYDFSNATYELAKISGEFLVVFVSTTSALIYKSFEYEVPVFWNGTFHSFTVSSFHENITDRVKVDSLAVFCFGDAVCLWEDINMVGNGEMIVLDKSGCNQCIMRLKNDAKSCDLKGKKLDELGDRAYQLLTNSVKRKIRGKRNLGIMLSSGIDSSALLRVLYELNADVKVFTWASENELVSESKTSKALAHEFGYDFVEIFVDKAPYNDITTLNQNGNCPVFRSVSPWWERACNIAKDLGVTTLISGHYASVFGGQFSLKSFPWALKLSVLRNALVDPHFLIYKKNATATDLMLKYRKMDILTETAKATVLSYICGRSDINEMALQEYCYYRNFFLPMGISHCAPYLDSEIVSFCEEIPIEYKSSYYVGKMINKIVLRASMINRLPKSIVNRTYSANLDYMVEKNLDRFCEKSQLIISSDSFLVRNHVINYDRFNQAVRDPVVRHENAEAIINAILLDQWLSNRE